MTMIEIETKPLSDVDEIAARRAVAGVDADILDAGGTPDQAEAVRTALRLHLLGDEVAAHAELAKVFPHAMADQLLLEFKKGSAAAAAPPRAA